MPHQLPVRVFASALTGPVAEPGDETGARKVASVADGLTRAAAASPNPNVNDGGSSVVQAYILIQTEVGKAATVAQAIREVAGVASAEDVTGPYDVIARVEAHTVDELGKLVIARIQDVPGITRTLTCTVVHV